MRPATSLQRHKTGWLPREKLEHLGPNQALAKPHPAGRIGPVRLKYPLRNIKPYRASLAHGRLPCGGYSTPPPWHIDAVGGRPHHQGGKELLAARRDQVAERRDCVNGADGGEEFGRTRACETAQKDGSRA